MPGKPKDYTGMKCGKLTAIELDHITNGRTFWKFRCECGNEIVVRPDGVVRGTTSSCGCAVRKNHFSTHGKSRSKLYRVYYAMKQRCENQKDPHYDRYGGRGISIDPSWKDFGVFYEWAIANGCKDGLTIDRIDNDGNYSPDNCRWTDVYTQSRNTSRNTWITYKGETMVLSDMCRKYGVNISTACHRIKTGKSLQDVFEPCKV